MRARALPLTMAGAYKTLPVRADHLPLARVVWADSVKGGYCLQLWSCPFGARASVHSWDRLAAALVRVLRVLFRIVSNRFVDDLFGLDRTGVWSARARGLRERDVRQTWPGGITGRPRRG